VELVDRRSPAHPLNRNPQLGDGQCLGRLVLDEKLECVICVVQNDLESLRSQSASSARSVDALTAAVQDLKKPVSEIVALRARVGGLLVGLGILGSALAWLAEPIYRWSVEQHYLKH
jgi:hypothetical protein